MARPEIPVLVHPFYSPDLAPCDFLFPKFKSALKGARFESVDAVKSKATEVMKKRSEKDLQHCFQQYRGRGGDHFEDDNITVV
jgi:hypothetical protein